MTRPLHIAPIAALAALLAASFAASPARANGRFPAANQLVTAPGDPQTLLLRTTFGLALSHNAGADWSWICEQGMLDGGAGGAEDPAIGITTNGSIVAGLFEGLQVSPDTGCSWMPLSGALNAVPIVDLVVRPDDPGTILALSNEYLAADDGGAPLFTSYAIGSSDNGATWAKQGTSIDPAFILETIEVAKSDPHRVYLSGVSGSGAKSIAALFVSEDTGGTWTQRNVPLDPTNERAPFISAVDPQNADIVYVRTSGAGANRVLVTKDAGKTFTTAYTSKGSLLGFALSEDGSKIYVGGPQDGLQVASTADLSFSPVLSHVVGTCGETMIHVQCLTSRGSTLYACSDEVSGFILGQSGDDGATFTPLLHLSEGLRGPIACPAGASASVCATYWPMQRDMLAIPPDGGAPADAGAPSCDAGDAGDGGGDAGDGGTATITSKGCGCGVAPVGAGGAIAAASLAIGALLARRRRRGA